MRDDSRRNGVHRLTATHSRETFAVLFKESSRTLWLIAAGIIGNRTAVEDVLQEGVVVALTKWDQFQPGTNFTAWMGSIVRFVALNHGRSMARHRGSISDQKDLQAVPDTSSPHRWRLEMDREGRLPEYQMLFDDEVIRGLDALTPVARTCLLLRTVEGMEYARIAQLLEIPEGTAMSHVHRSRQLLRERLVNRRAERRS